MKIYAISGLGADKRVFQFLNLSHEIVVIDWINPEKNEDISSYAIRMARAIDQSEEYFILGVSFGGLIATEISKKLNPRITILISSAETNDELRWIYRLIGKLKLIELIPTSFLKLSKKISPFLFGAKNKNLLFKIIDDTDLHFAKWSLRELTSWSNKETLDSCLKISGTKDLLIPPPKLAYNTKLIKDGGHFMIVDNAAQITKVINHAIENSVSSIENHWHPIEMKKFIKIFLQWIESKNNFFERLKDKNDFEIEINYQKDNGSIVCIDIDFMSKDYFCRMQVLGHKEGWLTVLDYDTGESLLEEYLDFTENTEFDHYFRNFFSIIDN